MKPEFENIILVNNNAENRFEMEFENRLSFIEYEENGNIIALLHTEVDPALEGRGAGTAIVEKTLNYLEQNKLQLKPYCPFVVAYLNRHPEWKRILHTS